MVIYKYKLGINGESTTITGKIRKILKVDFQPGEGVVCWCEVDDRCKEMNIKIICIGTEWDFLSDKIDYMNYIGTVQDGLGDVWHYYATSLTNLQSLLKSESIIDDNIFNACFSMGVN